MARHPGRVLDPDFVLDADARERLINRFGPGTEQWCDDLPELVSRYCQHWDLELEQARSGGTARVYLGRQHGGRGVVLKLTPDRTVADTEAIALRAWAASPHVVRLLDADPETGALLLERIEPGTKVSEQPELPPFGKFAEVITGLREADSSACGTLPPLAERVDFLFALIGRRRSLPRARGLVTAGMVARGHRLSRHLAASADRGLVHGDLGPPNVLDAGPDRGLVAIDPRPCTGDRTADVIDWALARTTNPAGLDERIRGLRAALPDLDGDRLRRWCQATAVINAVQRLYRGPLDDATKFLVELAATC
jgi:streptomycin 6-kinase